MDERLLSILYETYLFDENTDVAVGQNSEFTSDIFHVEEAI
jgi:hypothetical protein